MWYKISQQKEQITPVFRPTKHGNMVRVTKIWYKIYPNCWTKTKEQANCTHKSIWIFMTCKSWYFLKINQRDTTMCNICIAYVPLCQYWHWYCRYGGILVKAMMELKNEWHTFQFLHCYWQYAKTQRSSEMRQQSPNLKLSMTHWPTDWQG